MKILNTFAFDIDDAKDLEGPFKQLKQKDTATIVIDELIQKALLRKVCNNLTVPKVLTCSFQNLIKLSAPSGDFYIGQILLDFGFPIGNHSSQNFDRVYQFQVVGFADIDIDLGRTILRPETKKDKLGAKLFNKDIDLENFERFNEQYYLTSNKKEILRQSFNKQLVNVISKYNNLVIYFNENEMYITFNKTIENNQMRIIEEIFCSCSFLKSNYEIK